MELFGEFYIFFYLIEINKIMKDIDVDILTKWMKKQEEANRVIAQALLNLQKIITNMENKYDIAIKSMHSHACNR